MDPVPSGKLIRDDLTRLAVNYTYEKFALPLPQISQRYTPIIFFLQNSRSNIDNYWKDADEVD